MYNKQKRILKLFIFEMKSSVVALLLLQIMFVIQLGTMACFTGVLALNRHQLCYLRKLPQTCIKLHTAECIRQDVRHKISVRHPVSFQNKTNITDS